MSKKLCLVLVLVILFNLPVQVFAQQNSSSEEIKVYVNDTRLTFDVPPFFIKGFTMVPVRAAFEALGAKVEWDNYTKTATITRGGTEVRVQPGNRTAMVNNIPHVMEVPAVGIDGRVMVPVRFISEAIGARVDWVNETKTVFVNDITEHKESGNIQNGGRFAADSSHYFHILPDGVLIRENIFSKQKEKISDKIISSVHIVNDWIYCVGEDKGTGMVFRMRKDGSEKEIVVSKPVISMQIINGWIYYSESTDDSVLYRTKTDGTETYKVVENGDFSGKNWLVLNGWIYYINTKDQTVSSVRIDGSNRKNLTGRIRDLSSNEKIVGLELIDRDYLYISVHKDITDANGKKIAPGLYRVPAAGGEFYRITDKAPISVNTNGEWLYLAVENFENSYRLIRCKKDGSEVFTINEYKKDDIPGSIYVHGGLVFYTVVRGRETPEELLFCMDSYGGNIQQYTWIYGKDYYAVKSLLTDVYTTYRGLNSFQTVQTSSVENSNGKSSIMHESTLNRGRSLLYRKTAIDGQSYIETWLDHENLYTKKNSETQWDIARVSKQEAADMLKTIFDYIQPTNELCNNLTIDETEDSYTLKGEGTFPEFIGNVAKYLDLDENIEIDRVELNIRINRRRKYIEEMNLTARCSSNTGENDEIKQFTNSYRFINSQFNAAYLKLPNSVSQTLIAKEKADRNTESGISRFVEGKYEEAIRFFDTAIALYNKSPNAYLYKGKSLYNLKKYEEAILVFNRYHEINQQDTEVFALIGLCYFNMGDLLKAEEMGKETLKHRQSINAYNLLGSIAHAKEEYKAAEEYFNMAVLLDGNNYTSRMNQVSTLYSMGNYSKCIRAIDEALKYFPRDRDLLYIKAQCLSLRGRHEQAIEVYESILAGNPSNDFVTMTHIAKEYEILQNYQKAKEYADRAEAVYPDYSLLKYLLDSLDYNLSATAGRKLVDFITENYLYYKENEETDRNFESIIEKGSDYTLEDVRKLADAINSNVEDSVILLSGYEYEQFFNSENGSSIITRQDENHVYVTVKNLYPGTGVQFAEFIQSIENPGNKVLIIDLRNTGRGLSEEAAIILDALLSECTPGYIIDRDGYVRTYTSGKWHTSFHKIGILVNGNTAGSAEFLALGLKTFAENVTIIGSETAGRGVGQVIYNDRSKHFAVLLVNHYWNVLKDNIEGKGIEADIKVDGSDQEYTKAVSEFISR